MEHLVGQSLGRYRLDDLLGEGGMGAVFRANDITLQRQVAVKVMHPHIARRPQFRDRFLQEARTAARLDHPGIVKVFDFGQDEGHLYIVMEFIPGENLRDLLKSLGASRQGLVLTEAVQMVRQICLALDYAHRHGVLHRDIKPDNIMLKPRSGGTAEAGALPYQPVLTDLGLAKLAEGGLMTAEGVSMGTPAYMSPEQATGRQTDARSDVYSLGILLFELAVGRLPFPASTLTEAIRYHTQEPPPQPRSLRPDLPAGLEGVILQALAKHPDQRFADAGALAGALAAVLPEVRATGRAEGTSSLTMAISLATPAERERPSSRGPSIFDRFPPLERGLMQDRVVALLADGSLRAGWVGREGLTIGRSPASDLVIDDADVSRQHARVTRTGSVLRITDLSSTNGTFLGDVRLLPGVPERWDPDTPARLGNAWLRLEKATEPADGAAPDGRVAPPVVAPAWDEDSQAGTTMRPPRKVQPQRPPGPPPRGRRRSGLPVGLLVAASLLFLALVAAGAYVLWPRDGDSTPPPTDIVVVITPAGQDDGDGDGLTDAQEQALGTLTGNADTDGDGLSDGQEVNLSGTDPLLADSDGDGLTDGEEVLVSGTDPLDADSDDDGVPDGEEGHTTPAPTTAIPTTAVPEPTTPTASVTPTATASPTVSPTPTPTASSTATPTVTPTPPCAQAADPELAPGWDRAQLGCPVAPASVVWAAWEPFERGYMLWRSDTDGAYVFDFGNGSNPIQGTYVEGPQAWKWDGSFPDGRGLTPPPGLLEPVRGFGFVWYNFLGGPSSQVGWATDQEKGFCAKIQPFERGLMFHSNTVTYCEDQLFNWATHPSFTPLFFSMAGNGAWRRY